MRYFAFFVVMGFSLAYADEGSWSPVFTLPLNAIHTSLLPTGKVLMWGRIHENDIPIVWDAKTRNYIVLPTPNVDTFCSGHTFLSDGSVLVAGGHIGDDIGTRDLLRFDSYREVWTRLVDMKYDRWYPASVNLADGRVFIAAGTYKDVGTGAVLGRLIPEIYDPETDSISEMAKFSSPGFKYYPIIYPDSDGKLVMHRPAKGYRKLDPANPNSFWSGTDAYDFKFWQKSFVRFLPNRTLAVSSDTVSENQLVGLFNSDSNTWTQMPSSIGGRRDSDSTILADGRVLITGGSSAYAEPSTCTNQAEIFDPATGTLTVAATASVSRTYHSSAVLMPDGSVLKVGSGAGGTSRNVRQKNGEYYYPPYYFSTTRPVITSVTDILSYGSTVNISINSAKPLKQVALIRLGSATHGMNYSQFFIPIALSSTEPGSSNSFIMPLSKGDAPPGPYMLVAINEDGVPSVAKMVMVGSDLSIPPLTYFAVKQGDMSNISASSLLAADSDYASVAVDTNSENYDVASGIFEFTSTKRFVSAFRLKISTRWPMGGKAIIAVFNNYTGAYELMGTVNAGVTGKSGLVTTWFKRRLNAREYINQSTKKIRVRVTFRNPASVQPISSIQLDELACYFLY